MKTNFHLFASILCLFGGTGLLWSATGTATQPAPAPIKNLPKSEPYVVSRDANSRVWAAETSEQLPNGQTVTQKHYVTELASGMHYQNARGEWMESKEIIEAYSTGAIARQGQYQVIFANNLNTAGAIDVQAPDGKRLQSNVIGLMYHDTASDEAVMIAQLQDSQGELMASNQVLYPDAFEGVKADVRYTYKIGSFEQDIILREQPPAPEKFGLNPDTTEIEVMTEFIDPPQETIKETVAKNDARPDQNISWGAMRLGHGKAFDLGESERQRAAVTVKRQYLAVDGRKVLLEKVKLSNIDASLSKLPRQASLNSNLPKTASKTWSLPKAPLAQTESKPMRVAAVAPSNKGYVLDYVVLNTDQTNYTFQGDEGYRVKGAYNLSGTITFEGGTVIKCNLDGQINIDASSTIVCKTSAYRPAVFTSNNDDGIGAPGYWVDYPDTSDPYYTGTPALGDVDCFLNISCSNPVLSNMRFCYALETINVNSGVGSIDLWNCQFMKTDFAMFSYDADVGLHNVLIQESGNDYPIFIYYSGDVTAENLTSDGFCDGNGLVDGSPTSVLFANSIITCGSYVSTNGGAFTYSANPIYQVVGGGSYYLTNGSSYRNVGTTNISSDLLVELHQKTTYPPIVSNLVTFASNTTLSQQAQRDTDVPDLGYQYDPIGNLTNVVYAHATNVFRYDDLNRLTNMVDAVGSTKFTWTDGDQLLTEIPPWDSAGVTNTYVNRLRTSMKLVQLFAPPWTQNYGYDDLMRLTSVVSPAGDFAYDYATGSASDLVTHLHLPGDNGSYQFYINNQYDGLARLTNTVLNTPVTAANSHAYAYNAGSQRTQQTLTAGNYVNYTYDNIGQLKTAKGYESDNTPRDLEKFGYAYDAAWNLN